MHPKLDHSLVEAALKAIFGGETPASSTVRTIERSTFDQSYLEFLDEQIQLNARGPEWSQRLLKRRKALAAWAGEELVFAEGRWGDVGWTIRIDPRSQNVVHVETYE